MKPETDPVAREALTYYAIRAEEEHPLLSADLLDWLRAVRDA